MRSAHGLLLWLGSALLAATLPAQRTWIVDAAGGTGVDFTDIPPAVAASSPGDVILVRPSTAFYNAPVITHGLSLTAEPGGTATIQNTMFIRDVPATQQVLISGFEVTTGGVLTDCDGSIVIQRSTSSVGGGYHAHDCALVVLRDSDLLVAGAFLFTVAGPRDAVVIDRCRLRSSNGGFAPTVVASGPGWLHVVDSTILGPSSVGISNVGIKLSGFDTQARISGTSVVMGGWCQSQGRVCRSGIDESGALSRLWIDPLSSVNSAAASTIREHLAVSVGPAPRGATASVDLYGFANRPILLLASLPQPGSLTIPGLGPFYLDPAAPIPVASLTPGPSRTAQLSVRIPANAPVGLTVLFQAVGFDDVSQSFGLSGPTAAVVGW